MIRPIDVQRLQDFARQNRAIALLVERIGKGKKGKTREVYDRSAKELRRQASAAERFIGAEA